MTTFTARIDGKHHPLPREVLCDTWLADGQRFGDALVGLEGHRVLGRWPGELETEAFVGLAQAVGATPGWDAYAQTPPVAQRLAERAQPQPLDLEIGRHLQHLQHVCHRPRLHLRVEEERLPVSRAHRTPVRAVADLVSHPGDWEHRTLRSIQPSRVLARQIEDEWNLYENRVAARLVDHLLAYLAKRLEELRKIKEELLSSKEFQNPRRNKYGDEIQQTSHWRARRIAALWSNTLDSKTEEDLHRTMKRLELAHRDLQALLDTPLYQRVPQRQTVALALKPTNILVNDPHYRKVAALWRSWVKYGHKHQETTQQRAVRRQLEAGAWDQFVRHLVVRGFAALGWSATTGSQYWTLTKRGWSPVRLTLDPLVTVRGTGGRPLRILPVCADLAGVEPTSWLPQLKGHDGAEEIVLAHVGGMALANDGDEADRASGWSFGGRAVLFACSPWGIDSEERMARLLHGWLCRAAAPPYPVATTIRALPEWPGRPDWLRYEGDHLVAFRAPTDGEASVARAWAAAKARELNAQALQAKAARQASAVAPREAVTAFQAFVDRAARALVGMDCCPVCGHQGLVQPRPGKRPDGSDATWWASCRSCESEWGTRPCTGCNTRYHALVPQTGIDAAEIAKTKSLRDWPDKLLGHDVWAQPCSHRPDAQFRCPTCGQCTDPSCVYCHRRLTGRASDRRPL